MVRKTVAALLFGPLLLGPLLFGGTAFAGTAAAQTPSAQPPSTQPPSTQAPAALPVFDPASPPRVDAGPLAPGATAFTEAQARRWLMRAGMSNIMDLTLGEDGIWRGQAERQGNVFPVSLDRNGDIATR